MFIYTLEDIISLALLIFCMVVWLLTVLIMKVSNWFNMWWKTDNKEDKKDE